MRKLVSIAVSAALVLSLTACNNSNTTSTAASSAATSDAASSEESTSDSSTSTASSAADNATAEPDIQFDESFQPQTIADNNTCTIILQNVGYDDSYGYYWTVDFQNKTDGKTLCAITSSSSLNGIPADTSWFPEIGPGVKTTEVVSWDKAGLEIYGVKPHNSLPGMLHGDEPCSCRPGIPRFQSWEVSTSISTMRTAMRFSCVKSTKQVIWTPLSSKSCTMKLS